MVTLAAMRPLLAALVLGVLVALVVFSWRKRLLSSARYMADVILGDDELLLELPAPTPTLAAPEPTLAVPTLAAPEPTLPPAPPPPTASPAPEEDDPELAADGGQCTAWVPPLPPEPGPIGPDKLRRVLECWATNGTFRHDPRVFAHEAYHKGPDTGSGCYILNGDFARSFEAGIVWEPSPACELPYRHVDGRDVCRTINGRNVLLVGDSLTLQYFHSFQSLVQRALIQLGGAAARHVWNTTDMSSPFVCNGPHGIGTLYIFCQVRLCVDSGYPEFTLTFNRNDRLTRVHEFHKDWGLSDYWQFPWVDQLHNNSIVVLNRGAHYTANDDFAKEYYTVLRFLAQNFTSDLSSGRLVFVRATPPGHKDCQLYVNKMPILERQDPTTLPYHWGLIAAQNELARKAVAKYYPRVLYLDVDTVTGFRRDSHVGPEDSLHYCRPGPIDFWVELLINSVRAASALRTSA